MITKFYEFLKLNEEVFLDSTNKLRDSVHDIIITKLKKEFARMKVDELCKILATEYGINIDENVMHEILSNWESFSIKDRNIFTEKDKSWMDYWPTTKEVSRKVKEKKAVFGKGRRKLDKSTTTTYNDGWKAGRIWSYKLKKYVDREDMPKDDADYDPYKVGKYGGGHYGYYGD